MPSAIFIVSPSLLNHYSCNDCDCDDLADENAPQGASEEISNMLARLFRSTEEPRRHHRRHHRHRHDLDETAMMELLQQITRPPTPQPQVNFYDIIKDQLPEILAVTWARASILAAVHSEALLNVTRCGPLEWKQACEALGINFDEEPFAGNQEDMNYRSVFAKVAYCIARSPSTGCWDKIQEHQPGIIKVFEAMMDERDKLGIKTMSKTEMDEEGIDYVRPSSLLESQSNGSETEQNDVGDGTHKLNCDEHQCFIDQ